MVQQKQEKQEVKKMALLITPVKTQKNYKYTKNLVPYDEALEKLKNISK